MNPAANLIQMLPPMIRAIIYGLFALLGLGLAAAQSAYGAIQMQQPNWLIVSWVVYGIVGTGTGLLAAGNVAQRPKPKDEPDSNSVDLLPALPEDGDQ